MSKSERVAMPPEARRAVEMLRIWRVVVVVVVDILVTGLHIYFIWVLFGEMRRQKPL